MADAAGELENGVAGLQLEPIHQVLAHRFGRVPLLGLAVLQAGATRPQRSRLSAV